MPKVHHPSNYREYSLIADSRDLSAESRRALQQEVRQRNALIVGTIIAGLILGVMAWQAAQRGPSCSGVQSIMASPAQPTLDGLLYQHVAGIGDVNIADVRALVQDANRIQDPGTIGIADTIKIPVGCRRDGFVPAWHNRS